VRTTDNTGVRRSKVGISGISMGNGNSLAILAELETVLAIIPGCVDGRQNEDPFSAENESHANLLE